MMTNPRSLALQNTSPLNAWPYQDSRLLLHALIFDAEEGRYIGTNSIELDCCSSEWTAPVVPRTEERPGLFDAGSVSDLGRKSGSLRTSLPANAGCRTR